MEKPPREEKLAPSLYDALVNGRPEDLIQANPAAEVLKGTMRYSCGWLHGPAHLELLAAADRRLTRVAELSGMVVRKVERVRACLLRGTKVVVIHPVGDTDRTGEPVRRYDGNSSAWINLFALLGENGLTVESGYKERYEVSYIPKNSPFWPGLAIDLGQVKERRKKGDSASETTEQTG